MKTLVKLALAAAAAAPCAAFGLSCAPQVQYASARGLAVCNRCPAASGVLGVSCVVPRRPPPPPPKKATVGAGGASHQKIKNPELQPGAWREELDLGECSSKARWRLRDNLLSRRPSPCLAPLPLLKAIVSAARHG